jgi:hypothetical protein
MENPFIPHLPCYMYIGIKLVINVAAARLRSAKKVDRSRVAALVKFKYYLFASLFTS